MPIKEDNIKTHILEAAESLLRRYLRSQQLIKLLLQKWLMGVDCWNQTYLCILMTPMSPNAKLYRKIYGEGEGKGKASLGTETHHTYLVARTVLTITKCSVPRMCTQPLNLVKLLLRTKKDLMSCLLSFFLLCLSEESGGLMVPSLTIAAQIIILSTVLLRDKS